jgi:hypothetical protein
MQMRKENKKWQGISVTAKVPPPFDHLIGAWLRWWRKYIHQKGHE